MAPLSHHLQDSTHTSFGVVTTGFVIDRVKLEGSAFNGREPNEQRDGERPGHPHREAAFDQPPCSSISSLSWGEEPPLDDERDE